MASQPHSSDPAWRAVLTGQARADAAGPPWTDRTVARHDHNGDPWAVIVDWAQRPDGTRVPASVTISSLGGTFAEPVADTDPVAVTRAVVESVPWGEVLWGSRRGVQRHHEGQRGLDAAYKVPPPAEHDALLRRVGAHYRRLGGAKNPRIALSVAEVLETEGYRRKRGGDLATSDSGRAAVRRWISQAKERGYDRKEGSQ